MKVFITCRGCGESCPDGSRFCLYCGGDMSADATATPQRLCNGSYPHQESLIAYARLEASKSKVFGLVAAAGTMLATGAYFIHWWLAAVSAILLVGVLTYVRRIRMKEYYKLPHSRDADGEHRCIFCGNRGVWRRGEYRTDNTHAHCSKCQEHLYVQ